MARRRPAAVPSTEPVPDHLARFVEEDWVAPGEVPPHLPTTVNGGPPTADYIAEEREILAWGRWRRAKRRWLAEHPAEVATP